MVMVIHYLYYLVNAMILMINLILELDFYLFYFINTYLSNPIFDYFFVIVHNCHKKIWFIIPVIFFWILYIFKDKKNRMILIILIPVSVIITDQIGKTIKNIELRQRPYMSLNKENIKVLINAPKDQSGAYKHTSSSKKSFPSNHAANICSLCYLLSYMYNNQKKYFITLAFLISISRIYIGVHYPTDVMTGAVIGLFVGYLLTKTSEKLIR